MVGRVITSDSGMSNITVIPQEDYMAAVPQFSKARFGAPSYDASQVDAWVSEVLSKSAKLSSEVSQLQLQLSTLSAKAATMHQSSEEAVASKNLEISRKNDEIKRLNDKIADLKADLAKEKSRNSLTGVADELDALRNKTQELCDKRIAEATAKAQGIQADADKHAQAHRQDADEYSANTKAKADEYSKNTRADADNYAETVKAEADAKAQGIIDEASKRSAGMIKATKENIQALRNKSFAVLEQASKAGIDKLTAAEEARSSVAKLLAELSAKVASFSNNSGDVLKELQDNTVENLSAEFESNVLNMTSDAQTVDDVLEEVKKSAEDDEEPAEDTGESAEDAEELAEEPAGEPEESAEEPAFIEEPDEEPVEDAASNEEPAKEPVEDAASAEESSKKFVEDTVTSNEPPAPPVQKANASQGITTSKKTAASQQPSKSESAGEETVVLPVADSTDTQEELPVATSEMTTLGLEAVADME